jgi:hypothetical protein
MGTRSIQIIHSTALAALISKEGGAMSVTKLHERFERIERAYLAALAGRDPETVPPSIWRAAIFAAVPGVTVEEIIEMFRWQVRKASRGNGFSSFGSTDLIKTLVDSGMCKACAIRVVPLICTRATASEDCICSDKCADALDRWAHPFGFKSSAAPCLRPFQERLDRARARTRSREASAPPAEGAGSVL